VTTPELRASDDVDERKEVQQLFANLRASLPEPGVSRGSSERRGGDGVMASH
jgi:hypothetical protein